MVFVNIGDFLNLLYCGVIREFNGWECIEVIFYVVDDIN